MTAERQQGRLIDLGPDGLGFIVPTEYPRKKLAFLLEHLNASSFAEAGLSEGATVEFHLNHLQQIDQVTPLPARASSTRE